MVINIAQGESYKLDILYSVDILSSYDIHVILSCDTFSTLSHTFDDRITAVHHCSAYQGSTFGLAIDMAVSVTCLVWSCVFIY